MLSGVRSEVNVTSFLTPKHLLDNWKTHLPALEGLLTLLHRSFLCRSLSPLPEMAFTATLVGLYETETSAIVTEMVVISWT